MVALVTVTAGTVGCSALRGPVGAGGQTAAPSTPVAAAPPGATASTDATTPFESAAYIVTRSVVNVSISQAVPTAQGTSQSFPTGNGSGIVIRPDGYILTNDHVVAGSSSLLVGLGMTQIPAKVVGRDPSTDLAVIKIARTNLIAAVPGDPKILKRGQWVIAVGSPFGLERTVTAGIVSALNRATLDPSGGTPAKYTNLIQTDASINPGNSGGALATLDGRVVGVNSLTESPTGASAGIGLAIPFDFAVGIADQLIKTGHAIHPYIGVGTIDLDQHVATVLGVRGVTQGALVQSVPSGTPAAKAGIKRGDVITMVGDVPVTDSPTMFAALRAQTIGSTVPVKIVRAGQPVTVQVTIGSGRNG
jgi:putative serine protease PepD